jgi:hypothetical protein
MPGTAPTKGMKMTDEGTISIRAATLQEVIDFFIHVWQTVYHGGIYPALLDWGRLPQSDEFFVAERNGEIIGAAALAGLKNK